MSCGQIALRDLGIEVGAYYASEIDKFCIAQTRLNFPGTIQLGDVRGVDLRKLPKIDLILAGSPCQGFSFAGKQLNFDDPRSALFFEFVRILKECREINPDVLFMFENVRMKREYEQVISDTLGIKPVMINSALVSAQNRMRLYCSNIRTAPDGLFEIKTDIPQPKDRGLFLRDILEDEVDAKYNVSETTLKKMAEHADRQKSQGNGFGINIRRPNQKGCTLTAGCRRVNDVEAIVDRKGRLKANQDKASCLTVGGHGAGNHSDMDVLIIQRPRGGNKGGTFTQKSPTLSANAWAQNNLLVRREVRQINQSGESGGKQPYQQNRVYDSDGIMPSLCSAHAGHSPMVLKDEIVRHITPTEAARLQAIPDWYRWECSATQQYKMLGNGWTVEVIKHIFSFIKQ